MTNRPRRSAAARAGGRLLVVAAVLAGLLVVAWLGLWFWAAASVEGLLEDWAEAERARGATIAWEGFETTGFPLRIRMAADSVEIDRPGQGVWRVPELAATAVPWRPTAVSVVAPRGVAAALPAPAPGLPPTTVDVDRAAGRVAFALDGGLRAAAFDLSQGTVGGVPGLASVEGVEAETVPESGVQVVRLRIADIGLEPALPAAEALGTTVERVALDAVVAGPLPRYGTAAEVAEWRDAGGSVPVEALILDWGPLAVRGAGELTLDGQLRPVGALRLEIAGHEAALAALAEAGVIGRREAGFVIGALSGATDTGEDGVARAVATVRFAEGWVSIGPIPIARVGKVVRQMP